MSTVQTSSANTSCCFSNEEFDSALGDHGIERDVGGSCCECGDSLAFVGDTDEFRSKPAASSSAKTQRPVVITRPAAQAVAMRIETHQRQQDEIQRLRGYMVVARRFENAVSISTELRRRWRERHPLRSWRGDSGEVSDTAVSTQQFDEWCRIELAADGQVDANTQAGSEPAES